MQSEVPLLLKGGESKDVHYDWKPTLPGQALLKVTVKEGNKTTHDLIWKASVISVSNEASAEVSPTPEENPGEDPDNPSPHLAVMQGVAPAGVDGLSWQEKTYWNGKHGLVLRWEEHEEDGSRMMIEKKVMLPKETSLNEKDADTEMPFKTVTLPLEFSSSKREGSEEVREINSLPTGWHLLTLSRISKEGKTEAQSQLQLFIHPQESLWNRLKIPAGLLLLFLLGYFLWKQRN